MAKTDEPKAEPTRPQTYPEQMADLNVQAFNIEASRRTGKGLEETTEIMRRLKDEGDFFTDEGRWTLDVAGYPVLHKGWKDDGSTR
jgi:hypothetical protein